MSTIASILGLALLFVGFGLLERKREARSGCGGCGSCRSRDGCECETKWEHEDDRL